MTVLDDRALNRATLARQLLLDRAKLPVVDAVAHLCGLQAQEPQEPFVGMWSRLAAFDPAALSGSLTSRNVVRTHLMRRTVHLVAAEDALAWRSRHDAMLRQRVLGVYRDELRDVDLDGLAADAEELMADGEPRTAAEIVRELAGRWPGPGPRALGEMVVAALVPMAQAPPRGLWRTKGGVRNVALSSWLGRPVDPPAPDGADPVGRELVRRYLAAHGPAATADLRAWSGLAGLPAAVAAVRDELVRFRDERGRELLDLRTRRARIRTPPRRCASCRPSTTRSSATRSAGGSSTTDTAASRSPASAWSWSTAGSPPPGGWSRARSRWSRCVPSPGPTAPPWPTRAGRWRSSSPTGRATACGCSPRACLTIPVVARRAAARRQVRALGVPAPGPRTGRTWAWGQCGESACMAS
ncbi:hypothetical protein SCALM49S_07916 [Streptomyces californicus]